MIHAIEQIDQAKQSAIAIHLNSRIQVICITYLFIHTEREEGGKQIFFLTNFSSCIENIHFAYIHSSCWRWNNALNTFSVCRKPIDAYTKHKSLLFLCIVHFRLVCFLFTCSRPLVVWRALEWKRTTPTNNYVDQHIN